MDFSIIFPDRPFLIATKLLWYRTERLYKKIKDMNTHSNKHKPCFQSLTYLILMLGLFLVTILVLRFFYVEISISISRKLYILNRIKSIFLGKENVISQKKKIFFTCQVRTVKHSIDACSLTFDCHTKMYFVSLIIIIACGKPSCKLR